MLVNVDAKALEWRGAVWLSGDPVGIKELNDEVDIHAENQKAFSLPDRLTSKRYLFRTIFRGSGYAFSIDPEFSHVSSDAKYWDGVNEKFYRKYERLNEWHNELARLVASRQPVTSPLGREWLIPLKPDGSIPWTQLSNYPVQGTCADIMMVARISLMSRLRKSGLIGQGVLPISTVHDSIVLDVPQEVVGTVAELAMQVFNDLPKNFKKLWNITLPIAFPGEVSIGPNLGALK